MRTRRLAVAIGFLMVCSRPALAITITFESVTSTFYRVGESVTDTGYAFTNTGGDMYVLMPQGCTPRCAYNGTQRLLAYGATQPQFLMTHAAGTPFSLLSLDLGESFSTMPHLWARTLTLVGTRANGRSVTAQFALDFINDGTGPLIDYQSIVLPKAFRRVTSVRFFGTGGVTANEFTIDNVVAQARPVPEPATVMLLGTGLVGIGARRLKRRRRGRPHLAC